MNSMIQTVDLTKKFNDFVANDHINLDVKEQEIKCIVGENGAGKSTMMNMLYGLLQPTSGKILIRGKEVTLNSPVDAIANGIGMVHQHFKLVPSLTVYENILLGAEITQKKGGMKTPFIDQKEEIKRVEKLIQENHLELNATDKIEDISVGGRQRVEILKMLYRNVDILILDEPTAVLTPQEVDELIATLKNLKEQGKTIIVITHKLREVMELADGITVIKQGKVVGNVLKKDTSERELAQMMVGSSITFSTNFAIAGTIKLIPRPITITLPLQVIPKNENTSPHNKVVTIAAITARATLPVRYSTNTEINAPFSIIPSSAIFNTFALYANIPPITHRIIGALWYTVSYKILFNNSIMHPPFSPF